VLWTDEEMCLELWPVSAALQVPTFEFQPVKETFHLHCLHFQRVTQMELFLLTKNVQHGGMAHTHVMDNVMAVGRC
jgi:hypothetical protein